MKTRVCLKYIVQDRIWKQFFASNPPKVPLNLICLSILVTLRMLTPFKIKLKQLIYKKVLKFVLLDSNFFFLLTEP